MNKYKFDFPNEGWDTMQFCKRVPNEGQLEVALFQHNAKGMEFYRVDEVDARIAELELQLAEAKMDIKERYDAHNELYEQHESLKKSWDKFEAEAHRQQLTEAKKNINSLCNILESTLRAIDASGFSSDVFTDWLIEQGVEVSDGTI